MSNQIKLYPTFTVIQETAYSKAPIKRFSSCNYSEALTMLDKLKKTYDKFKFYMIREQS